MTIFTRLFPLNLLRQGLTKRRTIHQLNTLPTYLLADIGIERDAIPAVVDTLLRQNTQTTDARPLSDGYSAAPENDLLLSRV